ncbi:Myb-like DNA-binding domain containing protein [Tritrichomonas foetus]|uniref:Myb-like DNA-binding domain containing protein n=1 Tax=Tritrichomonas foetus TaxID=1144522 RepID=A0A1J4L1Y2_9EUKA|nr:Myb-like DNA-binding domain containing protein [Tritrichomonas foetus]|eukprot:OHT17521.1 Myb-like DNA-binding domain containing protein [Tritrichomonas foetus]
MHHTMEKFSQRQKFTKQEDNQLLRLVKKYGTKSWEIIAQHMSRRTGRQCRDRYNNHLLENFTKGSWTPEEDQIIISNFLKIGPRWSIISKKLTGRSGNDIKNRWHKKLSKLNNLQIEIQNSDKKENQDAPYISNVVGRSDEKIKVGNVKEKEKEKSKENLMKVFSLYEQTGQTWNMFPTRAEADLLWDN